MKSIYFTSYALMATVGALVVGWAQYRRKKREGAPLNLPVLKAVSGIAIAMWVGAGVSAIAYSTGDKMDMAFIALSVLGIGLVGFFSWQMLHLSREFDENRKALKDLATRDALTHSWNRRIFEENLHVEVERAKRSHLPLSLLMFDIDDFAEVNEAHGFKIGDAILRELVSRIFSFIRPSDTVYRYGGEEIALILPGVTLGTAKKMAEDLTKMISDQPYQIADLDPISITVSIGVAAFDETVHGEDDLVDNAIRTLHASKAEIGNFISVSEPTLPEDRILTQL